MVQLAVGRAGRALRGPGGPFENALVDNERERGGGVAHYLTLRPNEHAILLAVSCSGIEYCLQPVRVDISGLLVLGYVSTGHFYALISARLSSLLCADSCRLDDATQQHAHHEYGDVRCLVGCFTLSLKLEGRDCKTLDRS